MPTGYTADVQDGKVTDFPTFAMRCARAFGALIMMRDEPMDAEIRDEEPSDYHPKKIVKAKQELADLRAMTHDEIVAAHREAFDGSIRVLEDYRARKATTRDRYEAMLEKVQAWEPPTPDHRELKRFMAEQLTSSIDFDCGGSYEPPIITADPDAWYGEQVSAAIKSVEYHEREHEKDVERAAGRNAWVKALRESLELSAGGAS